MVFNVPKFVAVRRTGNKIYGEEWKHLLMNIHTQQRPVRIKNPCMIPSLTQVQDGACAFHCRAKRH